MPIVKTSTTLDSYRRYLTDSMKPSDLAATLKAVDDGDAAAMVELLEEMEGKDAHLQGVLERRREALTALDWSIEPDEKAKDQNAAREAAQYCQSELDGIDHFTDCLQHLAFGIGAGVACVEKVLAGGRIVDFIPVPGNRLISEYDGAQLSVITDENVSTGVPMMPQKFVIHTPQSRSGAPMRVTLARALGYLHVLKHYCLADWAAYSEIFGMPFRIATYDETVNPADRTTIKDSLKNMSADMYGVFPKGVVVEFKEATKSNDPYAALIDWCEKKQSILVLGQTLTTDVGSVGSLAAARVHENVRASISLSDINGERRTIEKGVLRQMVGLRWPGRPMPIPNFKRKIVEDRNLESERLDLEQLQKARDFGLAIDPEVMYERLRIPPPKQPTPEAVNA